MKQGYCFRKGKSGFFYFVEGGVDVVISGVGQVGFCEVGVYKEAVGKVCAGKVCLREIRFSKVDVSSYAFSDGDLAQVQPDEGRVAYGTFGEF